MRNRSVLLGARPVEEEVKGVLDAPRQHVNQYFKGLEDPSGSHNQLEISQSSLLGP